MQPWKYGTAPTRQPLPCPVAGEGLLVFWDSTSPAIKDVKFMTTRCVKAEGINIGEMRMLVKQVRKGRVTIEEAAEDAGMTVEEFKKVMENTPLQAV